MKKRIINSILDNDLYKFTMMYAVSMLFPWQKVRYKFKDRNNTVYPDGFDVKVKEQLKMMEELYLTDNEKKSLFNKVGIFLSPTFIDFLSGYRFNSDSVKVYLDDQNHLQIEVEGYMYREILWEVVILTIVSELYFLETGQHIDIDSDIIMNNDINKIQTLQEHNAYHADFGTRRRYSYDNQDRFVKLCKEKGNHTFVGTSNVHFSIKYDIKAIGTHAHEWFMLHAAIYGYKMATQMALKNWSHVFGGMLGIALTDTLTSDVFFKSFTAYYAKLFDGLRHDSSCPFEFTDKVINHYKNLNIDPATKTIVYSDGLNAILASKIKEYCVGKIKSSFGIGTNFTNDVGVKPLSIVMKLWQVQINDQWHECVKIPDNIEKSSGDAKEIEIAKYVLKIM